MRDVRIADILFSSLANLATKKFFQKVLFFLLYAKILLRINKFL